jgi:hypothetical protein
MFVLIESGIAYSFTEWLSFRSWVLAAACKNSLKKNYAASAPYCWSSVNTDCGWAFACAKIDVAAC